MINTPCNTRTGDAVHPRVRPAFTSPPAVPVMSSASDPEPLTRRILLAPFRAETWRRTLYGVLCLPVAVLYFALTIPLFLVGTPLIVVFGLGFILSLVAFWISRQLARLERARLGGLLRQEVRRPDDPAGTGNPARRWWARCRSATTWRTLAFMLTNLPLSLVVSFLSLYPWVQTVYSLSYPIVQWNTTFTEHAWGGPTWLGAVAVHTLPGIPMLFAAPWLVKGATSAHALWVRLLLGVGR